MSEVVRAKRPLGGTYPAEYAKPILVAVGATPQGEEYYVITGGHRRRADGLGLPSIEYVEDLRDALNRLLDGDFND